MKKNVLRAATRTTVRVIGAVFCVLLVFTGCYNEIVPQSPSERDGLLPIAGAANVRDLGGYRGAEGKTIKYGLLIRSGELNGLTDRDRNFLAGMGITTVVDFRSDNIQVVSEPGANGEFALRATSERRLASTNLWSGAVVWDERTGAPESDRTGISETTVVPDYEDIIRANPQDATQWANFGTPRNVIQFVRGRYADLVLVDNAPRQEYLSFFRALINAVENEEVLLYHCSAGKDRAGVASALLLLALGVSEEDIIRNFMISEPLVRERFFPVVPMIRTSVAQEMRDGQGLLGAINMGGQAEDRARAGIRQSVTPRVAAGFMVQILNPGPQGTQPPTTTGNTRFVDKEQSDFTTAESQARDYIISDQGEQAILGGIDRTITQMQPTSNMSSEQITNAANDAAARIAPLLSVSPQWIISAIDTVRDLGTTGKEGIEVFLDEVFPNDNSRDGAWVISQLRSFYLN
jgi:protein-tyrosine phosphatase